MVDVVPLSVVVESAPIDVDVEVELDEPADALTPEASWTTRAPVLPTPTTTIATVACVSRRAPNALTLLGRGVCVMTPLCQPGLKTR